MIFFLFIGGEDIKMRFVEEKVEEIVPSRLKNLPQAMKYNDWYQKSNDVFIIIGGQEACCQTKVFYLSLAKTSHGIFLENCICLW